MTNRGDFRSVLGRTSFMSKAKSTMAFRKSKTTSASGARVDVGKMGCTRKISSASAHPVRNMAISAIELVTTPTTPFSSMTEEELIEYKSIFQMFDKRKCRICTVH